MKSLGRCAIAAVLAVTWAGACAPPPHPEQVDGPPPAPPLRTIGTTVRDARSGEPLPTAAGRLAPDGQTAEACENQDGRLLCPTRATGGGDLHVEATGYIPATRHIALDENQPELYLQRIHEPPARLVRDGRRLRRADGRPFQWRFATAFGLLADLAAGREARATVLLDWLADQGFTGARVMGMNWNGLSPDAAALHLPQLLTLAADRGLYVEVVLFVGTRAGFVQPDEGWFAHAERMGARCAAAANCLVELANENYHPTQDTRRLTDLEFLRALRARIPAGVLVSFGAGESDEIDNYPGGDYVTIHLGRVRDPWHMARHKRELELVSAACGCFVVDDEPIGAGDSVEHGRRATDPGLFFGLGVLGRVFEVGSTFHFQAGLEGDVPGPVQQAAASAFLEGARIVEDDVEMTFKNAGWTDSPVRAFRFADDFRTPETAIRAYAAIGRRSVVVLLGVTGDPGLELRHGWRIVSTLTDRPGIRVLEIER